jgi:tRNA-2-methylthio-N6-dimethylallyladenosine synthase
MFVYSPRRGTPAALWEQIAPEVGTERLKRLAAVVDTGVRAWHERKRGTIVRALVQGPSRKDRTKLAAKTGDNVTVIAPAGELDESVLRESPWLDIRIADAFTWGVSGTVEPPRLSPARRSTCSRSDRRGSTAPRRSAAR